MERRHIFTALDALVNRECDLHSSLTIRRLSAADRRMLYNEMYKVEDAIAYISGLVGATRSAPRDWFFDEGEKEDGDGQHDQAVDETPS